LCKLDFIILELKGITSRMDASISYIEMVFKDVSGERFNEIKKDLLKYCKLDTEGMVWIVEKLKGLMS